MDYLGGGGGGGGGAKGMLPPPQPLKLLGGGRAAPPSLFLRLCVNKVLKVLRNYVARRAILIADSSSFYLFL